MQKKDLQKSIEDLSNALEQGCGAVYRRNFDSVVYEYMGRYIKQITGYDADELTPEIWDNLILETEQRDELAGLSLDDANRLVRAGEVERWQADVQIRTRSGETRWVTDMSTILRDESGTCFGCLGVLLDITDRKEAEKKLADLTEKLRVRNQEMDDELAMAREVQQALVSDQPNRFPRDVLDGQARVDFYHRYIPAEMLAGDFFDILPLSDREVGVLICDVVGHGVRAALLTTFLRGLVEELVPYAADPGTLLSKINHSLRAVFCQGDTFLFASAFYLVLDVPTGRIRYANAGHPHPLCLQPEAGHVKSLSPLDQDGEPALGIIEDFTYSTLEYVLTGSESLLLYTDGLFEAYDENEELYGEERVVEFFKQQLQLPAEQQLDNIIMDVHRFSGSDVFEDDVCLLAVVPAHIETKTLKGAL
jgi:sigma-B regulation protein RsbU (phosphoserine phosphatase)